jgi:hypothetical protein
LLERKLFRRISYTFSGQKYENIMQPIYLFEWSHTDT